MLVVAVAVAGNQILNGGVWVWWWIPIAVALAAALGGLTQLATRRRSQLALAVVDELGQPPLVAQARLTELGIYPTPFGVDGNSPYVARDVDDQLESAVRSRGVLVVHGPRLAGTTRAMAHAVIAELPDYRVVVPSGGSVPVVSLTELIAGSERWTRRGGVVVWLERLGAAHLDQLDTALLESVPTGMLLCLTCDSDLVHGRQLRAEPTRLLQQGAETLAVVGIDVLSSGERNCASRMRSYRSLWPLLDEPEPISWGRPLVAWRQLERLLQPSGEEGLARVALLRAVTDWRRLSMPAQLTRPVLKTLYRDYWRELASTNAKTAVSVLGFADAVAWAQQFRPRLVDRVAERRGKGGYVPYPLLEIVAEHPQSSARWPVSEVLWDYASRELAECDRRRLGMACLDARDYSHACILLDTIPLSQLEPATMYELAKALDSVGRTDSARHWYGHTIETGHPDGAPIAMYNLGALEYRLNRADEARDWWLRAIDTDLPDVAPEAVIALGVLEVAQGRVNEARGWYGRAIKTGHHERAPRAMVALGALEVAQGRVNEARGWYGRAIKTGHPEQAAKAMVNLGVLEEAQGRVNEARGWYGRAIKTGHPEQAPKAMVNLGMLEKSRRRPSKARGWYSRAIKAGHPESASTAMFDLGMLELDDGRIDEARKWYGQAVDTAWPDVAPRAMVGLGFLEVTQGRVDDARDWYGRAIKTDDPEQAPIAMLNLGSLEAAENGVDQARYWWQRAVDTDRPDVAPTAMVNLGMLLQAQAGHVDEARSWYSRGIKTGHPEQAPKAMMYLGALEANQGRLDEARHWLRQAAANTTNPAIAERAVRELKVTEQRRSESDKAIRFAKSGFQFYYPSSAPEPLGKPRPATDEPT
ncbi:tetratricopeptide repeat protein [Amycolatopsis sp. RTGN1]|uniref:tetratricopeptide repeat protein n=1 Tax=Amycolatopsis ponsaeliensis TaxID=2992142 RepID=UPI00254BFE51|nr:tetratricopeptide repeat protein [Amycolatopsis sp. RTGN1]